MKYRFRLGIGELDQAGKDQWSMSFIVETTAGTHKAARDQVGMLLAAARSENNSNVLRVEPIYTIHPAGKERAGK